MVPSYAGTSAFMEFDLGFFDEDENWVAPAGNPFSTKVLPPNLRLGRLRYKVSPMYPGSTEGVLVGTAGFNAPRHGYDHLTPRAVKTITANTSQQVATRA